MESITLTELQMEILIRHSNILKPIMSAAILLGVQKNRKIRVKEVLLSENSENTLREWSIPNDQLIEAYKQAEDKELQVVGIFSSHTNSDSDAYPSNHDQKTMTINPSIIWMIYSSLHQKIRAYTYKYGVNEIPVIISKDESTSQKNFQPMLRPENYKYPKHKTSEPLISDNTSWDVFISHAYEDKEIVESFVEELKINGISVWYDKDNIRWGDSLMESINRGLKNSLFGIVILSKTYLKKPWPKSELSSLLSMANNTSEKKILPLFYDITHKDIVDKYPIFADIRGRSWDNDLGQLITEIKYLVKKKKDERYFHNMYG